MPSCKCKRGPCPTCDAACRRCGCACDGVDPAVALSRGRGHRGPNKHKAAAPPSPEATPVEAKRARRGGDDDDDDDDHAEGELYDIGGVWRAFAFSAAQRKKLPSRKAREDGTVPAKSSGWSTLVQSVLTAGTRVAEIIYPGGVQEVLITVAERIMGSSPVVRELRTLKEVLATVERASPPGSVQRRVVRAVMAKGLSTDSLGRLKRSHGVPYLGAGTTGEWARADFVTLEAGELVQKAVRVVQRVPDDIVRRAVEFILTPAHTATLSWGTRVVKLSRTERVELPSLIRRMAAKDMFARYTSTVREDQRLGRSRFHELVRAITKHKPKLLTAIDYMTGELLNDSVSTLQDIIDAFTAGDDKERLTTHVEVARNFLKVQYDEHILKDDDDVATHGIQFGLRKPVEDAQPRRGTCAACAFVPFVMEEIKDAVKAAPDGGKGDQADALRVLKDVERKFELYQGHRARVINQQHAITEVMRQLEADALDGDCSTATVTIDFKMKFNVRSARETTKEHFAKRGMSWHGCMVTYFRRLPADGSGAGPRVEKVRVYVDQILENGNNQGVGTVMAMVEAMLHWISQNLPHITGVIMHSDNAKCYNSNELRLFLLLLNMRSDGVVVLRYVFTETQDGKGTWLCAGWLCAGRSARGVLPPYFPL